MNNQLSETIEKLARELPKGWVVQICVELGSCWVELISQSNETIVIHKFDDYLNGDLEFALDYAKDNTKCQN